MDYIMMVRTQITLPAELHRRARRRAAEQGVSLAGLVRSALERELAAPTSTADVSALFDLADSGASDVSNDVDKYVAEAIWADLKRG
jgi:hypothetical protein